MGMVVDDDTSRSQTSWWSNQPILKICASKWVHIPPIGVNIKHIPTQSMHHCWWQSEIRRFHQLRLVSYRSLCQCLQGLIHLGLRWCRISAINSIEGKSRKKSMHLHQVWSPKKSVMVICWQTKTLVSQNPPVMPPKTPKKFLCQTSFQVTIPSPCLIS